MSLKGRIEAIIYAAEEPITVDQIATLLKDELAAELAAEAAAAAAQQEIALEPPVGTEQASETANARTEEAAPAGEQLAAEAAPNEATPDPKAQLRAAKDKVRRTIEQLIQDYESADRGIEVRAVAGGYKMSTKPEHHDVIRAFAKSLKPPMRLSLPALETLAVIAYKQPITVPEISEIRGVDSAGVIGTLLERKLITTAGRKQVIGRPILYKTTREFLLRFGLKDLGELPSMEEFEKLVGEVAQQEVFPTAASDPETPSESAAAAESEAPSANSEAADAVESEAPVAQ